MGNNSSRLELWGVSLLLGVTFALNAQAALPPYYQSVQEFKRIVESSDVHDALNGRIIEVVRVSLDDDHYEVSSGRCVVHVEIVTTPNSHPEGWAGPREFEAKVVSAERCAPKTADRRPDSLKK